MRDWIRRKEAIAHLPREQQFVLRHQGLKGRLWAHMLAHETMQDWLYLEKAGILLCDHFGLIEILPVLHESDTHLRRIIMPGANYRKNPDFRIDGVYWELEKPTFPYHYRGIDQRTRKGHEQANHLILYFEKRVTITTVRKAIYDRMGIHRELAAVIIIEENRIVAIIKRKTR